VLAEGKPALQHLLILVCIVDALELVEETIQKFRLRNYFIVGKRRVEARKRVVNMLRRRTVYVPAGEVIVRFAFTEER
jgi:hypothetical protein